jgi:putative ubiquitin-RnfH superfamily antitoxin RatB of RatAB toxin-antitoxin module
MALDQQRFVDVKSGQSWSSDSVLKDGQRVCLTSVSLVDPASAAGQGVVVARGKSNALNLPIGHLSASSAAWELLPELVLDGEFLLYVNRLEDGDSAAVEVRFDFYVLPPLVPETLDQQLSRRPWSVDLAIGLTHRAFMKGHDRVCLTRVSLVDPGSATRQDVVRRAGERRQVAGWRAERGHRPALADRDRAVDVDPEVDAVEHRGVGRDRPLAPPEGSAQQVRH